MLVGIILLKVFTGLSIVQCSAHHFVFWDLLPGLCQYPIDYVSAEALSSCENFMIREHYKR